MCAMRRRHDVALFERAADADGDRLLPDCDVEEAGEIAGAKSLLDLFLEPSDEEHLAEKVDEPLSGEHLPFLLDLGH